MKGRIFKALAMMVCCVFTLNNSYATENNPVLNIVGAPASKTINEGGLSSIPIVLRLSETTTQTVKFYYRTIPGTAKQGRDYQGVTGTGYIAPGDMEYSVNIPVFDDNIPELPENFVFEISFLQNANFGDYASINCKIYDDDPDPVASLVDDELYVSEENGFAIIEIQLDRPSEKKVIVACNAEQASAKIWKDFDPLLNPYDKVVFEPGEIRKQTSVKIINDNIPEPTEKFSVNLSRLLNCSCQPQEKCNVYITDTDHFPELSFHDEQGLEGEKIKFVYTLSKPAVSPVSFNVSTQFTTGSNAAGIDDFVPVTNKKILIPTGQTKDSVEIQTLADNLDEGVEEFRLQIVTDIENATLPASSSKGAKCSIIDPISIDTFLFVKNASCREGAQLKFKVHATSPLSNAVTITYHTQDITATAGLDYQPSSGNITIPAGEATAYIAVQTLKDELQEGNEKVKLIIDHVTEGVVMCCGNAIGTIYDNPFPIAVDDLLTCFEDSSCAGNVLNNDIPGDGELKVVDHTLPALGTLILSEDGLISYTPPADYCGEQQFSYTVEDEDGDQSSANVIIQVKCMNDQPVANNDYYEIDEGGSVTDNVLLNDTGLGDVPITVFFSSPSNGILNSSNDGSFTYTPNDGFYGEEIFSYRVEDVDGEYSTAFVKIKVNFINNHAPVAVADAFSTQENTARNLPVLDNDYDLDGNETIDRQSIQIETVPVAGSASVLTSEGEILYTPAANWTGKDSLQYSVADQGGLRSNAAWVIVQVKETTNAPVAIAKNDTVSLNETGSATVYANDIDNGSYDPDGQEITLSVSPNSFSCGDIGENQVTLTVTDTDGLSASATAIVVVVDELSPQVVAGTCPDEIQVPTDPGTEGAVVEYSLPRFNDNCDGEDLGGVLTQGLPSGSFFPLGITLVQYEYQDNNGNGPAICSFPVIVRDEEPPVVDCPGNYEECISGGTQVVENISVSASDNITEPGNLIISYTITGATEKSGTGDASGEVFNLGESIVTYQVTDAYNNTSQCSFAVSLYPIAEPLPIQPVVP